MHEEGKLGKCFSRRVQHSQAPTAVLALEAEVFGVIDAAGLIMQKMREKRLIIQKATFPAFYALHPIFHIALHYLLDMYHFTLICILH